VQRSKSLADRRRALNLTKRQLAEVWEIDESTVWRIEGRRTPARIYELAMEAVEARAAAGKLVVSAARPRGRQRRPIANDGQGREGGWHL